MSHIDLSKELNTFSFEYNKADHSDFSITEETQKRVIISRLYYALFNRILEELPDISSSSAPNKHATVMIILTKQSSDGIFYSNLLNLFKDLKKFRIWADYIVYNGVPTSMNLNMLLQKVHRYIESKKVISKN